jgi:hypothetical protein
LFIAQVSSFWLLWVYVTCAQTTLFLSCWQIEGITDSGLKPHQMKSVAVIGGGLMGSGIATALVLSNVPVVLKEVNEENRR